MRITSEVSCSHCANRCDFYDAFMRAGKPFPDTEIIRVGFRKHERICRQGDSVSHAIYLTSGTAKLYIRKGINGHNIILYLMRPSSLYRLALFLQHALYYSVTAMRMHRYA
ncbi:MAG: cyclic nucleotide-binding domain-containing protein [Bacteroidales bacterium]